MAGLDYDIFLVTRIVEFRKDGFDDRASIVLGVATQTPSALSYSSRVETLGKVEKKRHEITLNLIEAFSQGQHWRDYLRSRLHHGPCIRRPLLLREIITSAVPRHLKVMQKAMLSPLSM